LKSAIIEVSRPAIKEIKKEKNNIQYNMDRIKTVTRETFSMFKIVNIILLPILWLYSYSEGMSMPWDYIIYLNIYAALTSLIFGYMDNAKVENRIIAFILIISFLTQFVSGKIGDHATYIFWGVIMGRYCLGIVDLALSTVKHKTK
jgi:hypothetical protein